MSMIEDGKGTGKKAKVNDRNQIEIHGLVDDYFVDAAARGNAFFFNTGVITLTSASPSVIATIKNTGDSEIVITKAVLFSSKSKEKSGTPNTQGTMKVEAMGIVAHDLTVAGTANKYRASSPTDAEVEIFIGGEAKTATGLALTSQLIQHGGEHKVNAEPFAFFLAKNEQLAFRITPPTGTSTANDSIDVVVTLQFAINDGFLGT